MSTQTYTVKPGDTQEKIARKFYGDGSEKSWRKIYDASRVAIGSNPSQIKVGMVLAIPGRKRPVSTKGSFRDLLEALGEFESGLPAGDPNQYRVENTLGFMGKYQFGEALLIDLGYYIARDGIYYGNGADKNHWLGTWTGKKGIDRKSKFQNAPNVQEFAIREAFALNWKRIGDTLKGQGKSINNYLNQTKTFKDRGTAKIIKITLSGVLAGAHLRGPYGVANLLLNNQVSHDEFGTSILRYMDEYGGYDTTPKDFLNASS